MIARQCAILIGGLGTRLGALTKATPKPLLPVAGVPFLEVLIGETLRRGFDDIILLAGYQASCVEDFAKSLPGRLPADCRIRVSVEPQPLGTGGAVAHAKELLDDTFLLLNGDTWFDFNWLDLLGLNPRGNAIAARQVSNADRHERLCISNNGLVTSIISRNDSIGAALVNGGVYAFHKSAFALFENEFSIEGDLIPELIRRSNLSGREYDGFFIDIGIPETFDAAQIEIPRHRRRPAVFFDRDGVLNYDDNYVGSVNELRWIEGAIDAVRLANELGYYTFVVTNQAGVARGHYDEAAVETLHAWMASELRSRGAWIDGWRYCPYHPEGSIGHYSIAHPWRKPEPGMILDLLEKWPVDISRSLLVGDRDTDCQAGRSAGLQAFLFPGGNLSEFLRPLLENPTEDECAK